MLTNKQLKDKILEKFGTPERIGIKNIDYNTGETEKEFYETAQREPGSYEGIEVLPNGEENFYCFNSARFLISQMGEGSMYGFNTEDNTAVTDPEILGAGGHNFAVFRKRFIVDLWITHFTQTKEQIIYDLKNTKDHAEIKAIFGDPEKWEYCDNLLPGEKPEDKLITIPKSPENIYSPSI